MSVLISRPHWQQPKSRPSSLARTGNSSVSINLLWDDVPVPPHSNASPPAAAITLLMERLSLTARQGEVLHWIAEGKTNAEISTILDCSFHTVKAHVREIFQRLGVHSRTAAAAGAYRAHIAEADALRAAAAEAAKPMPRPQRAGR
jgi:DNA-binding CsgD family transcriptional regulator